MTNSVNSDFWDEYGSEPLQRLCEGDVQALAELFSLHRERLLHIVSMRIDRRLSGRLDADDVLQEIFMDASDRIQHFVSSHPGSFFVWLRLIAMQTLSNIHRRHLAAEMRDAGRDVSIEAGSYHDQDGSSISSHMISKLTTPSRAAMRAETAKQLEEAVSLLAARDREILVLRHFEQLTNKEAAEVLGIQIKAASIRYVRALKKLKSALSQLSNDSMDP